MLQNILHFFYTKRFLLIVALLLGAIFMTYISSHPAQNIAQKKSAPTIKQQAYTLDQLEGSQNITIMTYAMPYLSGKMQDATALLFYPQGQKPKNGYKIVVWMHGTVGVADPCAPSRNPLNENFKIAAKALLAKGYVIIAPDYEGLGTPGTHPYLHLESEARAAIYAVKALKESAPHDFQGDWMVIGQSQGGQAALGTAEYANEDPHFKGAIAGAPASNLQMIIKDIVPKAFTDLDADEANRHIPLQERNSIHSFATILAYGAFVGIGIKAEHPHFNYLDLFYPQAQAFAKSAEGDHGKDGLCLKEVRALFKADIIQFLTQNPDAKLMQYPGIDTEVFKNHPTLIAFFKKSQPGTKKLDKPVLIIQGEKDTNVPAIVTEKLVDQLIALGSEDIQLILVKDASHTEAIVWENDAVIEFVTQHLPIE